MIKHIVAAGCSFTQCKESWAHRAEDYLHDKIKVHNVSMGGTGNYVISMLCISQIKFLLDSGVSPDEILVISQWTGIFRNSFVVDANRPCDALEWFQCKADNPLKKINDQNSKITFDAGRRKTTTYWSNFYNNYWSDECAFIQTLENILRTQWFLKSHNIKFLMFNGWDIFTKPEDEIQSSYLKGIHKKTHNSPHQWDDDDRYVNFNNALLKDQYRWSGYLWDLVDFDKFLFFENSKIKMGGLLQWVQYNIETPNEWYVSRSDHHPSWKGQELFFKNFLLPEVDKWL